MSIDLHKNGTVAQPQAAMITTSWVRDDYANGRRRYKLYAMHVPLAETQSDDMRIGVSHPRLAAGPTVVGEISIDAPNLEVAKMLLNGAHEMLRNQPPEIITVK